MKRPLAFAKNLFTFWLLIIFIVTSLCVLTYLLVQQNIRLAANDPQIQLAQDTKMILLTNRTVAYEPTTDIATSLSPFIMIFDMKGQLITSQASLLGHMPIVPAGVFSYAKQFGEDRFTWQPDSQVRIAAVVISFPNGYILAGRNIREIEKRENQLEYIMLAGWLITVIIATALLYINKKNLP